MAQGFLLGRPTPAEVVDGLLGLREGVRPVDAPVPEAAVRRGGQARGDVADLYLPGLGRSGSGLHLQEVPMSKLLARLGVPALAVLALAGCGSSGNSTTSTTTSTPSSGGADASVVAQVPAAIKSKGTLTVAADATYAPNEFIAPDGHTVIGMDADLMKALGEVMGLKVNLVNATFDTIIPGLASGKYDLGMSSFTDTKDREKTVDFVDYFNAGTSFYVKSSSNPGVKTVCRPLRQDVSVEKGTTEQEEAQAQSKKCTKAGKKAVTVLSFPDQNAANLASPAAGRTSAWPTPRSPPTRSSSPVASSSWSARPTGRRPTGSRSRRGAA